MKFLENLPEPFTIKTEREKIMLYIIARYFYKVRGDSPLSDEEYDMLDEYMKSKSYVPEYTNRSYEDDPIPLDTLDYYKFKYEENVQSEKILELSQEKTFSVRAVKEEQELWNFFEKFKEQELIVSDKVDGLSVKIKTENGKVVLACSKGEGTASLDYTKGIKRLLQNREFLRDTVYKAELYVELDKLDILRKAYPDKKFKTPKSSALSLIRRPQDFATEYFNLLSLKFFGIEDESVSTVENKFELLKFMSLDIPNYYKLDKELIDNKKSLLEFFSMIKANQGNCYCDGIVVEVNSLDYNKEVKDERYLTTQVAVKMYDWANSFDVGVIVGFEMEQQSAQCNCVALIAETLASDLTTASRINLHNPGFIIRDKLKKGTKIKFHRTGNAYNDYLGRLDDEI